MDKDFDERQTQIRGRIFQRGYCAVAALLVSNALLQKFGFVWADGYHQNMLIFLLITSIMSVECNIKGVYFAKSLHRGMVIAVFGLSSALLFTQCVVDAVTEGVAPAANGRLTEQGANAIMGLLFLINMMFALIQTIREKREQAESKGGSYAN
jgi:hypothetical protein